MPSIQPPLFEWHDLPSTPYTGDRVFSIFVPECETDPTLEVPVIGTRSTDPVTTWLTSPDWVKKRQSVKPELRDYVLRMHQKAGQGRLFFYGRALSEAERITPYLVEDERRMQFWPTVLLKLWLEGATDANGNVTYQDHSKYRDGNTYPTVARISHYLSDVQWPKSRFSRIYPLTDSIRASYDTLNINFPECLHPDVRFPAINKDESRSILFGAGTVDTVVGNDFTNEFFPATPMTDWGKYEAEVVKNQTMGHYAYAITEFLPPIDDREVTS